MTWVTINLKKAKHPFDSIIVFCFYIVYVFIIKGGYNYLNYNILSLKFRIYANTSRICTNTNRKSTNTKPK